MPHRGIVRAVLGLLLGLASLARAQSESFRPLFNGENLDGWVQEGNPNAFEHDDGRPVWSVRDGNILCQGKGFGFLRYDRETFRDFVFHVEFRMAPGCNSGLGFRTRDFDPNRSRETRPSFYSYEIQLIDDAGKPASPHSSGSLYRYVAPSENAMKPANEWNTAEIMCDGPRVCFVLNGKTIIDVDQSTIDPLKDKPLEGSVCLQNHGGQIEFRNIGIRELNVEKSITDDQQAQETPKAANEPVNLIFDTDICGDCDDVLALGMIHAMEARGDCKLLAVTVSADHPLAAPFVDAVNTFYGRDDVPIGAVGEGGYKAETEFLSLAEDTDGDRLKFPRDLEPGQAEPATTTLRRTLANAADGSVVVVQVGFSTNLARLLDTPPDDFSPLPGTELVQRKVKLLSIMAGAFQPIDGNARYGEYNVAMDLPACQALAKRWPTPVIWSGFEIGIALPYPSESILKDYDYVTHHPVSAAYIRRNPPPHNRPTWDLTSVLYAVHPDRGYFQLSEPGHVTIADDASSHFEADPRGLHRYLILDPAQKLRILEALVQLSSQPPVPAD